MPIRILRCLLAGVLGGGLLVGCASSSPGTPPSATPLLTQTDSIQAAPDAPLSTLDSLRAVNAALRDENRRLRDSIQLYDGIDSGRYFRELRALRDQMTRMSFELGTLRDGGQTVTVVRTDALFESAGARLSDAGREQLKPTAAQLRQTYPNRTIRVEGHSDATPVGDSLRRQFPTNWELSTARAAAVVRALIDLSGLDASQFVALGYGDTRPRAGNETESGRRRNRRVRIAVLPTPRDYSRPFETSW
jgi:chemotaxis protein MotB